MKIALLGYGKMGRIIERLSIEKGHTIVTVINNSQSIDEKVKEADVCIDFSVPDSAVTNISKISQYGVNLVMGTTGWYDQIPSIKKIIQDTDIGFLYSPNFSIGIHLFTKMVEEAAEKLNKYGYEAAGVEQHHSEKRDTPSGTAQKLSHRLGGVPFTSVRCGSIPGTHSLIFDSPADTITLTHQARNREGFAEGAITAAEWLKGKTGFYTLDSLFD